MSVVPLHDSHPRANCGKFKLWTDIETNTGKSAYLHIQWALVTRLHDSFVLQLINNRCNWTQPQILFVFFPLFQYGTSILFVESACPEYVLEIWIRLYVRVQLVSRLLRHRMGYLWLLITVYHTAVVGTYFIPRKQKSDTKPGKVLSCGLLWEHVVNVSNCQLEGWSGHGRVSIYWFSRYVPIRMRTNMASPYKAP